jgi:hypothetical protein
MKHLKRYRYLLIGLGLLVLLLAVWNGLSTSPRINEANFAKIKKGMTLEEVDGMLGTHDYLLSPLTSGFTSGITSIWFESRNSPWWVADNRYIMVRLKDGRVTDASLRVETRSLKDRFAKYFP